MCLTQCLISVLSRLRDAGWGEELKEHVYDDRLMFHALVYKPQELTDRVWKNIESTIIDLMFELRDQRLAKECLAILAARCKVVGSLLELYKLGRPATDIIPNFADVCEMPEFWTIIRDTPLDILVTERTFQSAMEQLPQLVDKWRDEKDAELLRFIDPSASLEEDRGKLDLAITVFDCKECGNIITYPRILVHRCMTSIPLLWRLRGTKMDNPLCSLWKNCGYRPWNFGQNLITVTPRSQIEDIVKCCRMDPGATSVAQMDELDARLECRRCYMIDGPLIMGWRTAVSIALFAAP